MIGFRVPLLSVPASPGIALRQEEPLEKAKVFRTRLQRKGWTNGLEPLELAKIARRDGQHFDCATWLHRAREMQKEDFRRAVEKELTGKEEEPAELIYFKVYKTQIPVIERAIETAALMLGTDN